MKSIHHVIKSITVYSLRSIDYLLFIILIMLKVFLFTKLTGTTFAEEAFFPYIALLIEWLKSWGGEGFAVLFKGIAMVSLGAILLSSFWILVLPRRARLIAFLTLNLVLSFIIFADLIYYRYFEDLISLTVLQQFGQVGALGDSISNLFSAVDWLFFIDILLLLPIVVYMYKKIPKVRASKQKIIARIVSTGVIFCVGYMLIAAPIKDFIDKGGNYLFEKTISNMRVFEVTGLLGFHGYDVYKRVSGSIFASPISAEEKNEIENWFLDHQLEATKETPFHGIAKEKNVILVQLEAFQKSIIDMEINGQEITPNLNELKEESMFFNRFYHQAALGRTSDAEFLTQASFYPMNGGSAYISYSGNTFTGFPNMLKDKGYSTAAFHAYNKSFWNRYLMYPSLGFDTFNSLEKYEQDEPLGWSIADESMLLQSVEMMKDLQEPFYSFLVTLTSHHPFDLPDEYKKLDVSGIFDMTFKNYLQSAHYVDKAVGTFIEQLKKEGMWDNSVVIFYGDHDSGLAKEGSEMVAVGGVENDLLGFNQMKGEVPLLIHLPGDEHAGVYEQIGGQIDLGPTILDLLGESMNDKYMMGTSLFNEEDRIVVFRTTSFYTEDVFYKAAFDRIFENGACYDMNTSKEISLQACEKDYDRAVEQLEVSDLVLDGDLIKGFLRK